MRLPGTPARLVVVGDLGGEASPSRRARGRVRPGDPRRRSSPTLPWFLIDAADARAARGHEDQGWSRARRARARREAEAAARRGERARVARDMHDVLAHSLSALALQLERHPAAGASTAGPTPRSSRRSSAPTASRRAGSTRRAGRSPRCAATSCPGPSACSALADAFEEHSGLPVHVTVTGEPRELARRGAAGALPHGAGGADERPPARDRPSACELRLDYRDDGTVLVVAGPRRRARPAAVGPAHGGGYGLTGMRERAELLGGRLVRRARPTTASAWSCGCRA